MKDCKQESDEQIRSMKVTSGNRRERDFDLLVRQFRSASDPREVKRFGDRLGAIVFGGG